LRDGAVTAGIGDRQEREKATFFGKEGKKVTLRNITKEEKRILANQKEKGVRINLF